MLVWEEEVRNPLTPIAQPAARHEQRPVSSSVSAVPVAPSAKPVVTTAARRVNMADKRIINGQTDVNQLVPVSYTHLTLPTKRIV